MAAPWFTLIYRAQAYQVRLSSAAGTLFTLQVKDRDINMPSSLLDFSTWDARCKQLPDLVLPQEAIDFLKPGLAMLGVVWRIGWKKKRGKPKPPKPEDPRQGKLF